MDRSSTTTPHAVLVSSPGMGHLASFLGLGNRLSTVHSFKATVVLVSSGGATHAPLTADDRYSNVNLLTVPAADISNKVDAGAHLVTRICALMRETAPTVQAAISSLTEPRPTLLVFDLFATEYLPIARDLSLPCFVYVTSAWFLALTVHCPVLDREVPGEYVDQTQPLQIPGCNPVRPEDVVEPMLQRSEPQYAEYLRIGAQIPLFNGVLIQTWQDLESSTLTALRAGNLLRVPQVYDIGAIVAEQYTTGESDDALMEWLDGQPAESVIYISFGSGGTLSTEQMNELALGLELSRQRFVWVVRPPRDDGEASGTYLGLKEYLVDGCLPRGFKERTREVGRLVPQWAPQSKVLSHPSLGGFLTHCGWNSIIESLTKGVPMMAWPMFAEQRMNATMLVEVLKVAIRTRELPSKKVVGREEIGSMVKLLLEGEEGCRIRLRAKELQRSAARALAPNGSSYNRLSTLVQTLKMQSEHHLGS